MYTYQQSHKNIVWGPIASTWKTEAAGAQVPSD